MDAKPSTTEPPRRFYKAVSIEPVVGGFGVRLDGRRARTPGALELTAPTEALAAMLAQEWDAQGDRVIAATMPTVRLACTALDRIGEARDAVCAEVARYAGADQLCYFAEAPSALVERQLHGWGPVLDWAEHTLGLHLIRTAGIVHQTQPAESLLRVARLAGQLDDFGLAGLVHASALFGSALLAFALQRDELGGELAFALSRIDETFQIERWGVDDEAAERAEAMRLEALMLERWFRALDP